MVIPRPAQGASAKDGGYRVLPWASVGGESTRSPWE
jgi:hypothetical protein